MERKSERWKENVKDGKKERRMERRSKGYKKRVKDTKKKKERM